MEEINKEFLNDNIYLGNNRFCPYVFRVSSSIKLSVFVPETPLSFYEVKEGVYNVSNNDSLQRVVVKI